MHKNTLLRVTQINAIYLDQEIEKSLQGIMQDVVKHLPPSFVAPYIPELNILIKLGILNYSILKNGSTFGQQLLNIQYENVTTSKKWLYLLLNTADYFRTRCELWRPSHTINTIIFRCYIFVKLLDFLNISIFLRNGEKPLLIERILGLAQTYRSNNSPRKYEDKYLTRELLWNGFIEIIVYVLPLINYYKLKRLINHCNIFKTQKNTLNNIVLKREISIYSKCAHCEENPILPHHMGCSHIFCYVCLKGNQNADPKYECPKCEHRNPNILCDKLLT